MTDKPDHLVRMERELKKLNGRITKLCMFFAGEEFNNLPSIDQLLFQLQYASMVQYQSILQARLIRT